MKPFSFCLLAAAALLPSAAKSATPFEGRWDLVVTPKAAGVKIYPDWMEVGVKDGAPAVRIQPRSGSAFYAKEFKTEGTHLSVLWANGTTTWDLDVKDGKLAGSEKRDGKLFADLAGVRAPLLKRNPPKEWTAPEPIFNGKDLTGWEPTDPAAANHYVAKDGESAQRIQGREPENHAQVRRFQTAHRIQLPRQKATAGSICAAATKSRWNTRRLMPTTSFTASASVYSMLAPAVELPRKPGTWESFDITLVGRWLTVVRNGVKTIDNQEIAGITGGALDSNEGEPGPFYIQGDHTGGMKYRNITIQVPKK